MRFRRPLALSAAVTLGIGALLGTTPAFAEESPPPLAVSTAEAEALAADAVAAIDAATNSDDVALGYGVTTAGRSVVFVDENYQDDASFREVAPTLAVDDIIVIAPPATEASTDIVGGAGILSPESEASWRTCSVGFAAWDPAGKPALVTAGHCLPESAPPEVWLSQPSNDTAHSGASTVSPLREDAAGRIGFAQFGGPGGSVGEQGDPLSTDIGVIDVTNDTFTPRPAVTDWSTAGSDDLAASATPIRNIAEPTSGQVSKSGRTTGLTSGSTTVLMSYDDGQDRDTEILDGYMRISDHWVRGFVGGALTSPGDSGGAVFQGDRAVGVVSGSPRGNAPTEQWAWYTRLVNALEFTGGYTVALDIDAPVLTVPGAGASLEPEDDIVVTLPSNATGLAVTGPGGETNEYRAENGTVRFAAPGENGSYQYTAIATNGHSSSEAVRISVDVKQTTPRPAITDQRLDAADGELGANATVAGTGVAGATVTVTGLPSEDSARATVAADGSWKLSEQEFTIGSHTLTAMQERNGEASAEATGTITIAPAAPRITSLDPDQKFTAGEAPSRLSGTGLSGAAIAVGVNSSQTTGVDGAALPEVGANGKWRASLGDTSQAGTYAVAVTQTLNGVESSASTLTFTVATKDTTPPPGGGGDGGDGSKTPSPQPPVAQPDGALAQTGGEMLPFVIGAAALALLAAGGVFLLARRLGAIEN